MNTEKKNVFIIGSKGIPAKYGGFETFVDKLTEYQKDENIQYYVACMGDENRTYTYHNAFCFQIKVPSIGAAKAVYYDIQAMKWCLKYIRQNKLENSIIYVLACRIGPFIKGFCRKMKGSHTKFYVNPDGHEWLRSKWNWVIKKYWKLSERLMIKNADYVICDSKSIEAYIKTEYAKYQPDTGFIAYGADVRQADFQRSNDVLQNWYEKNGITRGNYYLIVGRFVPENNYETMLREFHNSNTEKKLVVITNENEKLYRQLDTAFGISKDVRIKFVGTVYDQQLLQQIRQNAYAYLHGHEVGGTNPSLLEALGNTDLNLLLGVGFNREVAEEGALYWSKEQGILASLIAQADAMESDEISTMGEKARKRIKEQYSWNSIVEQYEKAFW